MAAATLVLCAGVAAAWLTESANPIPTGSATAYRVVVVRDGVTLHSFDLAALRDVGVKSVVAQGQVQEGPALLAVLAEAGVTDFSGIDVVGMGVRDSGKLSLSRSQIDADVVLAIAKRGTVKVAGPNVPSDRRVRDVTELMVR
jgi:hypothetical protein